MANKVTWKAFAKKVPRINHVLPFKHQTASVIDLFYRYNSFVHWYCTVLQLYSKDSSLTNGFEFRGHFKSRYASNERMEPSFFRIHCEKMLWECCCEKNACENNVNKSRLGWNIISFANPTCYTDYVLSST